MVNHKSNQYVLQYKASVTYNLILDKCRDMKQSVVTDYLDGIIKTNDYVARYNKINHLEQKYLDMYLPF